MNASTRTRIYSLDLLRGLVMVIMALDHTRDFFHYDAFLHDPLDWATTTPILYFTRWVTHFCAPVFVFLSGASIFLQHLRKSTSELSAFLLKRGLWLLFVEFVIITFAWTFSWRYPALIMGVIAAIGFGMVGMSVLIRLPFKAILALAWSSCWATTSSITCPPHTRASRGTCCATATSPPIRSPLHTSC